MQWKKSQYEVIDDEKDVDDNSNRLSMPQEELKINVEEHLNKDLEIENTNPSLLENNPFIYDTEWETPDN